MKISEVNANPDFIEIKITTGLEKPYYKRIRTDIFNFHKNIEWYFNQYIDNPFIAQTKAADLDQAIAITGETIYRAVFQDSASQTQILKEIEIEGTSAMFHSVHWEAIKAPGGDFLAAEGITFIRKNRVNQTLEKENTIVFDGDIRILLVSARPDEEKDVPYQEIQRTLIETLNQTQLPARIHVLRPGTFYAFKDHLAQHKDSYQIIHFDLHGGLLNYDHYSRHYLARMEENLPPNELSSILKDIEIGPFDGEKVFLFFESSCKGVSVPVDANRLKSIIQQANVPICLLNACQSGGGTEVESNLANTFLGNTIRSVVVMRYVVTLQAATLFFRAFYGALLQNQSLSAALTQGRTTLFKHPERFAGPGLEIRLPDWLVPVFYGQGDLTFKVIQSNRHPLHHLLDLSEFGAFPYGFWGRDGDILKIEKYFSANSCLLISGMPGVGKTALARYLGWWWLTTNWVKQSYYLDIKALESGWLQPGKEASRTTSWPGAPDALYVVDHCEHWDQLETSLDSVKSGLIEDLKKNQSAKILLLSQGIPNWLENLGMNPLETKLIARTFTEPASEVLEIPCYLNTYELLPPSYLGNYRFSATFLEKEGVSFAKTIGQDERKLMFWELLHRLVGGNPQLLIQLLPLLKQLEIEDLVTRFLDGSWGELCASGILSVISGALTAFNEQEMQTLFSLFLFRDNVFLDEGLSIETYQENLTKAGVYESKTGGDFVQLRKKLLQTGLLRSYFFGGFYSLSPFLSDYLMREAKNRFTSETLETIISNYISYWNFHCGIWQKFLESGAQKKIQAADLYLTMLQLNVFQALLLSLKRKGPLENFFHSLALHFTNKGHLSWVFLLKNIVWETRELYSETELSGRKGIEFLGISDREAATYMALNRYQEAQKIYLQSADLLEFLPVNSKAYQIEYNNLGNVSLSLSDFENAEKYLLKGLKISEDDQLRDNMTVAILNGLSNLYIETGRHEEAVQYLNKGLQLAEDINFEEGFAIALFTRGILFERQGYHQKSLEFALKALPYFEKTENAYRIGQCYYGIGVNLDELGRPDQAQEAFSRAISFSRDAGDQINLSCVFYRLGVMEFHKQQFSASKDYFRMALDNFEHASGRTKEGIITDIMLKEGIILSLEKKYEVAVQHNLKLAERMQQNDNKNKVYIVYKNLAIDYLYLQNFEEAGNWMIRSFKIAVTIPDISIMQLLLNESTEILHFTNKDAVFTEMLQILGEHFSKEEIGKMNLEIKVFEGRQDWGLNITELKNPVYEFGLDLISKGNAALSERNWEEAESLFMQAIAIFEEKVPDPYRVSLIKIELIESRIGKNDLEALKTLAEETINALIDFKELIRAQALIDLIFNREYAPGVREDLLGLFFQIIYTRKEQGDLSNFEFKFNLKGSEKSPANPNELIQAGNAAYLAGYEYAQKRAYPESEKALKAAAGFFSRANETIGLIQAYEWLGIVLKDSKRYDECLVYFQKALDIIENQKIEHPIIYGEANFLIGEVQLFIKQDFALARRNFTAALDFFNREGEAQTRAKILERFLQVDLEEQNIESLVNNLEELFEAYVQLGDVANQSRVLQTVEHIFKADAQETVKNKLFEILYLYEDKESCFALHLQDDCFMYLIQSARSLLNSKNYKDSKNRYLFALELTKGIEKVIYQIEVLSKLGYICTATDDDPAAKDYYWKAIETLEGNLSGHEAHLGNLGYFYQEAGRLEIELGHLGKGYRAYEQAVHYYQEAGDQIAAGKVNINIALFFLLNDQIEDYLKRFYFYLRQAIDIVEDKAAIVEEAALFIRFLPNAASRKEYLEFLSFLALQHLSSATYRLILSKHNIK